MKQNGEDIAGGRGLMCTFDDNKVDQLKYEVFNCLLNPNCDFTKFQYSWKLFPLY